MSHDPAIARFSRGAEPAASPVPQASSSAQPSRWRRRAFSLVAPALLVVAVWGGHSLWTWQAERNLKQIAADLRSQGEPASRAEFSFPAVADADNAAFDVRDAGESVTPEIDAWASLGLPLNAQEQDVMRPVVASSSAALQRLRVAMGKSGADWTPIAREQARRGMRGFSARNQGLYNHRALSQLVYGAALLAHQDNRHQEVLERMEELLFLARVTTARLTISAQLNSLFVYEFTFRALDEILPDLSVGEGPHQASPQQVRKIIQLLLDEHDTRDAITRVLRVERARYLDVLLSNRNSALRELNALDARVWNESLPLPLPSYSLEGRVTRPVRLRQAKEGLERLSAAIASFERAADYRQFLSMFPEEPGPTGADGESTRLLAFGLHQLGRGHYWNLAQRRTTALALALVLYRAEHGGQLPPSDLAAVVPAYLPKMLADPLATSGEPLMYISDARRPRVYSVGEDGIDDGGWPPDPSATHPDDLRMTDWVVDLARQARQSVVLPRPPRRRG